MQSNLVVLKKCVSTQAYNTARSQKQIGYWFLTCSGMVFGAVLLGENSVNCTDRGITYEANNTFFVTAGGVTRLTESGLSMVTWKLFGEMPPTTEKKWKEEFNKYKKFPEYKL